MGRHGKADARRLAEVIPDALAVSHAGWGLAMAVKQRLNVQVKMAEGVAEWRQRLQFRIEATQCQGGLHRRFIREFGKTPQPAPQAAGRALLQQQLLIPMLYQQHNLAAGQCRFFHLEWPAAGVAAGLGGTQLLLRALATAGVTRGAAGCAQVHHRLVVISGALGRGQGLGQLPQLLLAGTALRRQWQGDQPCQYPPHIAIEDGVVLAQPQRQDGARSGAADAGQGGHLCLRLRKNAAMLAEDLLRCLVQVAATGVVAKPSPQVQHIIEWRRRQGGDIREARHKALVIGDDRGHLRLLQHDLRYPHPVRAALLLPGQIFAPMAVPPGEQLRGKAVMEL